VKGFLSYAHADGAFFKDLAPHLKALKRAFTLNVWTDHEILAGTRWEMEIANAIAAADVFVLLISPGFIASDYVWEKELPAIRERRDQGGALVLPVVVRRCMWDLAVRQVQAIPMRNGALTPLADWPRRDHALDATRKDMARAIQAHFALPEPASAL
jgi:hypothetical protein